MRSACEGLQRRRRIDLPPALLSLTDFEREYRRLPEIKRAFDPQCKEALQSGAPITESRRLALPMRSRYGYVATRVDSAPMGRDF